MPSFCTRNSTNSRGEGVKRIVCIGGSIANLIAAYHLSEDNDVTIIDVHAEIGMPCGQPGFIQSLDKLKPYMTQDQLEFLKPHSNEAGWGFRSEWMTKLLALNTAQQGAKILTRTRITSIALENKMYTVQFSGGGPTSTSTLMADQIINASHFVPKAPGSLKHVIDPSLELTIPQFTGTSEWFGGTALTSDCDGLPESGWRFDRSEGLSEVWFEGSPQWQPAHGWIEQIIAPLPSPPEQRTIDAQIDEGRSLAGVEK